MVKRIWWWNNYFKLLNKRHLERAFLKARDVIKHGDIDALKAIIKKLPEIVRYHIITDQGDCNYPLHKQTLLTEAVRAGKLELVELLITLGADVNFDSGQSGTVLQQALSVKHEDIAVALINAGANVKTKEWYRGRTPLGTACENGLLIAASLILDKGADINQGDGDKTPLHLAVSEGHVTIANLLVSRGVELNTYDACKEAPIHTAVAKGDKDMLTLLLSNGADVNSRTGLTISENRNLTPLHFAAENGNIEIAELLLNRGADVNVEAEFDVFRSKKKMTPMQVANIKQHEELVDFLRARGGHE